MEYLGYVISQQGVAADPAKLQAIHDWPIHRNTTALRAFLGLSGYYHCFVRNFATVSNPLTDLLKKNQFEWNPLAQTTFQALKDAMRSLPVQALLDFSLVFDVTTDASGTVVGAMLSQASHPIAFFSKKLAIGCKLPRPMSERCLPSPQMHYHAFLISQSPYLQLFPQASPYCWTIFSPSMLTIP